MRDVVAVVDVSTSVTVVGDGCTVTILEGMGVDGLGAYELAVAGGFVGTEAEWLVSLEGAPGEAPTAANIGAVVAGAATKVTPVDADSIGLSDSAAGGVLKKLTWANLKATLKTYFDTIYALIASLEAHGTITGPINISAKKSDQTGDFTTSFIATLVDFEAGKPASVAFGFSVSGSASPNMTISSTPIPEYWTTQNFSALADGDYVGLIMWNGGPKLSGVSLSYVDGGAGDDTIEDLEGRFISAGFKVGDAITTAGSTTAGNDLSGVTLTGVTATTLTFATGTLAASEVFASDTVIVTQDAKYKIYVDAK